MEKSQKKFNKSKSKILKKENKHNFLSLILSFILIFIFLFLVLFSLNEKLGISFIFLPIILIIFNFFKIIRYFIFSINLKNNNKIIESERLDIYIYEKWHKKYVGILWMYFTFIFVFFYFFALNELFFILKLDVFFNFNYYKKDIEINNLFLILNLSIFLLVSFIFLFNKKYIKNRIIENENSINILDVDPREFELVLKYSKKNYKFFFTLTILLLLPIFVFLLIFKKIRNLVF